MAGKSLPHRSGHSLRTAERTLSLLEVINRSPLMNTSEVARATGLSRATASRVLNTLIRAGYVERPIRSKRFRVTNRVLKLSAGYTLNERIVALAQPLIEAASQELIWPLVLARPYHVEMQVLASTGFDNPLAIRRSAVGERVSFLETASARTFLATLNERAREHYLQMIEEVTSDRERFECFRADVRMAKRQKYAIFQADGSPEKAISVPVLSGGKPIAALSARFIASAISDGLAANQTLPVLRQTAAALGAAIGDCSGQVTNLCDFASPAA